MSPFRTAPHVTALAIALGLGSLGSLFGTMYVRGLARHSIRHLTTAETDAKILGVTLIREAFRHPDLLPNFGSSELIRGRGLPFYGPAFFAGAPSGFVLFPVADLGATPLAVLLRVSAAGPEVQGRRVVLSFTPTIFVGQASLRVERAFLGNFSPLQATLLTFSADLSPTLSRDLAAQLLKHPAALEPEPLLHLALRVRASGAPPAKALYLVIYPLGKLQAVLYRLADDFLVWREVSAEHRRGRSGAPVPNWTLLADSADRYTRAHASGNVWGIEDNYFAKYGKYYLQQKGTKVPDKWLGDLQEGHGWPELDLLLRLLRERGAKPLIVTMPRHGLFDEFAGLSAPVRNHYYERFRAAVEPYGFPFETFQQYDTVKYFLRDPDGHMSPKGWLVYDQLVDAFYHDSLR